MASQLVQFTGIENVVDAFINRGCKYWSIWAGRQFLFSCGEGGGDNKEAALELNNLLEKLEKNRGVYTLKVYDKVPGDGLITEKTPCHGSFNFRLMPLDETEGNGYHKSLKAQIEELRAEKAALIDELENGDGEGENDFLGRVGNILVTDPQRLPLMISAVKNIFDMFTTQTKQTGQPVALGAVPADLSAFAPIIERLQKKDPKLLEHLQKLESLPDATLNQLLMILDNM